MKRRSLCILTLVFLFLLAACGKQEDPNMPDTPERSSVSEKINYIPEYHSFDLDCQRVNTGCVVDGNIYFLGVQFIPDHGNTGAVVRLASDGTLTEIFSTSSWVDGAVTAVNPYSLCAGENDTFWLLLNRTVERERQFAQETLLCQFDSQGTELTRLDVTGAVSSANFSNTSPSVQLDADSGVYLFGEDAVYVLDSQQRVQFSLPCDTMADPCSVLLPDGRVAALTREAKGPGEPAAYELRTIDREAQDWGEVYPIHSERCYQLFPGGSGYLFFWNTGEALWGWNEGTCAGEVLLDASNSGVNSDPNELRCFTAPELGQLAAVTWEAGRGELAVFTPADPDQMPEKTVLTLACAYLPSQLQWYVTEFNKASQDCQIEVKAYLSEEECRDNTAVAAGIQRMVVDITAGNVPDLLFLGWLSPEKFAQKGILEDLWPYIDGDPKLSREDLMTNVLSCAQVDGRLCQVFDSFTIKTVAGASDVVGDRLSWTVEDLEAALAAMPEGASAYGSWEAADLLLEELVSVNMDRYVDRAAGTCAFDGQEFKDLLGYVGGLGLPVGQRGAEVMWVESLVMDKRQMLYTGTYGDGLTNFLDIQLCETIFGGPVSFVGHPRLDGGCGSSFCVSSASVPMAMTTACKDKEGAWSFLRMLLLPQDRLTRTVDQLKQAQAFPINRWDFDALAQLSMTETEPGTLYVRSFSDGNGGCVSINITPLTQAEYDQIMALYNAIDTLYDSDADIIDAIRSEASVYFSGDIGLDEAADRIQRRVRLYLDEQR